MTTAPALVSARTVFVDKDGRLTQEGLKILSQSDEFSDFLGTTTNDDAEAGHVGEYIESVVPSASFVTLVSGTAKTITSISLTAGDWDVGGNVGFFANAATSWTFIAQSISLSTNTLDKTPGMYSSVQFAATVWGGGDDRHVLPSMAIRLSLAATTTVFLIASASFTINSQSAYGIIWARRAR